MPFELVSEFSPLGESWQQLVEFGGTARHKRRPMRQLFAPCGSLVTLG